jgi:hypothetical protein
MIEDAALYCSALAVHWAEDHGRRYTNMLMKKSLLFALFMLFTASAFAEPYHHHRRHHHHHHYHHHHAAVVIIH